MKSSFVRLFFLLMAAGVSFFVLSGCRQPRARWDWTTQQPPPRLRDTADERFGPGYDDADFDDWDPMEWEGMGAAPRALPGDLTEVEGHRISTVIVYFAFDRSTIGDSERPKLESIAEYMRENAQYHLVIEGHCDERGSAEYNRGLGERRALAVKDYLVNLGVSADRLNTISYGIERPEIPNATTEQEHAQNRRAEFIVGIRE